MTATISTPHYLLDQARRRFTPSFNNFPGMGLVERRLLNTQFPERKLADPPPGSGLKPVVGDAGLPVIGHIIEMLRGGPDYLMFMYRTKGPVIFGDSPVMPAVAALGPDAAQTIYSNRNKDYSQQGWVPVIGPFFNRGLMLLDFEEHLFHRRIMQEAFTRARLVSYVEQMDKVVSQVVADDWVVNDARFLLYPAMKELTLNIASMVFMGHEPGTDHDLVTKVNRAFAVTTRAGNAIIRTPRSAVHLVAGAQGARTAGELLPRARQRATREGRQRPVVGAVPQRRRGRQQVQRRGHRQPHDLPDDGRARHVDVQRDDDDLPPGRKP